MIGPKRGRKKNKKVLPSPIKKMLNRTHKIKCWVTKNILVSLLKTQNPTMFILYLLHSISKTKCHKKLEKLYKANVNTNISVREVGKAKLISVKLGVRAKEY